LVETQIKNDVGKYRIQSDGSLQILGVSRADAGSYTCVADNGFGVSALKQTQLSINVLPDTRAYAEKSSYPVGSEINIDCAVRGHPQPQVTWLKDGVLLEQSDRVKLSSNHSLMISGANGDDSGTYTCQAINLIGSSISQITLTVEGKFEITNQLNHESNWD